MNPRCVYCGSLELEPTGEFDSTMIHPSEALRDFKCNNCGGWVNIAYSAYVVTPYKSAQEIEEDSYEG